MIAVSIVFWLSLSLSGPYYLRLWGTMYPPRILGRVVGFLGSGRAAAAALAASPAASWPTDRRRDRRCAGGAGRARLRGRVRRPAFARHRASTFVLARDSSGRCTSPILTRVAFAQGFYGGGMIAALPLYAIVNVDRLDLSLSDVGSSGS